MTQNKKIKTAKTFTIFLHTASTIIDEHTLEIKSPDTHFSTFMNYLFAAKGYLLQRHRGIFCNLAKIKLKEALGPLTVQVVHRFRRRF